MMICDKCKNEISDTAKFCPKCGAPGAKPKVVESDAPPVHVKTCPSCGAKNPLSAKFCRVDGHVLSAAGTLAEPAPDGEVASKGLLCPVCGTGNSPNAKFCKKDGTPLGKKMVSDDIQPKKEDAQQPVAMAATPAAVDSNSMPVSAEIVCATCGTINPITAKFCKKDGTPLQNKKSESILPVTPETEQSEPDFEISGADQACQATALTPSTNQQPPNTSEKLTQETSTAVPIQLTRETDTPLSNESRKSGGTSIAGGDVSNSLEIACPVCGTINPSSARFCKKDGTLLKGTAAAQESIERERASARDNVAQPVRTVPPDVCNRETVKRSSKKWLWVSLALILFLSCGGASAYYFYFYKKAADQTAQKAAITQSTSTLPASAQPGVDPGPTQPDTQQNNDQAATPSDSETKAGEPTADTPAPVDPRPSANFAELEQRLNKSLKKNGISGIYGAVSPRFVATLEGTARNQQQKVTALRIARSINGISEVKSNIQVEKIPIAATPSRSPRSLDPAKLEGELNRALRNQGLPGVTAVVSDNYNVKLKGSVESSNDKEKAILIARSFHGVNGVSDMIFVVE